MKRPYKIRGREEGRGTPWTTSFPTLAAASAHIQSHWQGTEYKDSSTHFHTDYATFELIGFSFADIGKTTWHGDDDYRWPEFEFDKVPGVQPIWVRCESPAYDDRDGICGVLSARVPFATREEAEAYVETCYRECGENAWIELTPAEQAVQAALATAEEALRVAREAADPIPF